MFILAEQAKLDRFQKLQMMQTVLKTLFISFWHYKLFCVADVPCICFISMYGKLFCLFKTKLSSIFEL